MRLKLYGQFSSDELLQMLMDDEISLLTYILHQPAWLVSRYDLWCTLNSREENDLSAFDFLSDCFSSGMPPYQA